jgi:hypothetical protein
VRRNKWWVNVVKKTKGTFIFFGGALPLAAPLSTLKE